MFRRQFSNSGQCELYTSPVLIGWNLKISGNDRCFSDIFRSFEKAVHEVAKTDTRDVQPGAAKMIESIDLEEYMKITLSDEDQSRRTLVDEANHRALNLITKSTVDHDSV